MKTKNKMNKKGAMALSQIIILLIGMIAISWAIGGGIGVVSGSADAGTCVMGKNCWGSKCSADGKSKEEGKCVNDKCIYTKVEDCSGWCSGGVCVNAKTTSEVSTVVVPVDTTNNDDAPQINYEDLGIWNDDGDGIVEEGEVEKGNPNEPNYFDKFQKAIIDGEIAYASGKVLGKVNEGGLKILKKVFSDGEVTLKEMKQVGKTREIIIQDVSGTATEESSKGALRKWLKDKIFGEAWFQGGMSALAGWSAMNLLLKVAGQNERNLNAIQSAWTAGGAFAAGAVLTPLIVNPAAGIILSSPLAIGFIVGALIVTAVWASSANVFSQDIITYKVSIWQPVYGGRQCKQCNDIEYGCSEYQCKTFGKACEIINSGSKYALCAWDGEGDRDPPIISILEDVLNEEFKYEEFENTATSPPERGMKIVDPEGEEKCLPAFSDFTFGIQTDEYAYCRWDYLRQQNLKSMVSYLDEGGYATINHTMFVPNTATASTEALEAAGLSIEEGRNYDFFIKCADRNGNENPLHFLVSFCVEDGPDTDAPIIKGTSYDDIAYISYNQSSVNLDVYTNEPATCKWDHADLSYEQMNYNLDDDYSTGVKDYLHDIKGVYGASGKLSGLKNYEKNVFYIRCKDKPWWKPSMEGEQFANEKSYVLTLQGTKSLYIDEVTINGKKSGETIKDSSNEISAILKVKTSSGAEEGKAMCDYSSDNITFYDFYNEGSNEYKYENTQKLWFGPGEYNYFIKCSDAAGNSDTAEINFTIETDREAPIIVRAFREGTSYIKVITNEEAECVYSLKGCEYEFEDGLPMMTNNNIEHFEDWNTNLEYSIKCKDEYGNQPKPNQCNMVVRASDF